MAKEAVTLDPGSGDSWYVMGNAYVASFFRLSGGMKDLDRALQAYKKSVGEVASVTTTVTVTLAVTVTCNCSYSSNCNIQMHL